MSGDRELFECLYSDIVAFIDRLQSNTNINYPSDMTAKEAADGAYFDVVDDLGEILDKYDGV